MNIVVLAGGLSPERDVSLSSGSIICNTLLKNGHKAILVDPFLGLPELNCSFGELFDNAAPVAPYIISKSAPSLAEIRAGRKGGYNEYLGENVPALCKYADLVFMGLHGDVGENGTMQTFFEAHGIRFTGSDGKACRLAMNKWIAKQAFLANGVPTPDYILLQKGDPDARETAMDLGFPCVIKPCSNGSSIGVTIVRNEAALDAALQLAFSMEDDVLVERCIVGRELSCGVLDGKALPLIELIPSDEFYDYACKYQAGMTREITPAPLDETTTAAMQRCAEKAFAVLGLSVYGRADFMLDAENKLYCLELNTLPGMTPLSLLPQEAAADGIPFAELCERIIRLSMEKYQ